MDSTLLSSIIGSATQVGSTIASNAAQSSLDSATRSYNWKMYDVQRNHALEDWNRVNEYNSPAQVMNRLKMAGLNPNLIYGQGQAGNAGPIRAVEGKSFTPQRRDWSGLAINPIQDYYNLQFQKASLDNMQKMADLKVAEKALKIASTSNVQAKTAKTQFDTQQAMKLGQISLDYAAQNLLKLKADTQYTLDQNERAAAQNAQSIQEGIQRILLLRKNQAKTDAEKAQIDQQIKNARIDADIKAEDLKLRQQGVQPGDNILFRKIAEWLSRAGVSFENVTEKARSWFDVNPYPGKR